PLPFSLSELRTGLPRAPRALSRWGRRFQRLDRALHAYERRPLAPLRRLAIRAALERIVRRPESEGGGGGLQPPWVYSLLALHLPGYAMDHPVMARGLAGLERFLIVEGDLRRLEACQSPVWDTALAMIALRDAGMAKEHAAM